MDNLKNILKSFKLKETLNPEFWDEENGTYSLKPKVREKLLQIANDFIDDVEMPIVVDDIIMTGSLANYNWSKFSDVDIHILVNTNQFEENVKSLYDELFHLKKTLYNKKHNITIYGYEVEVYIEDTNESKDVQNIGKYSIITDEWVETPTKESVSINYKKIESKAKEWMKLIDNLINEINDKDLDTAKILIKKYKAKLKKFRTCGLQKGGEYSEENLVFKILRRNGYLEKVKELKTDLTDKEFSMGE
jgi:predicted nucleotidyltransferase